MDCSTSIHAFSPCTCTDLGEDGATYAGEHRHCPNSHQGRDREEILGMQEFNVKARSMQVALASCAAKLSAIPTTVQPHKTMPK